MKPEDTLARMRGLYRDIFGTESPEVPVGGRLPLPPGVDPRAFVEAEASHLARCAETWNQSPWPGAWHPPTDAFATEDAYIVEIEAPGAKREEIQVMVSDGECWVRGERPTRQRPIQPLVAERPTGRFERRFPLPRGVRPDAVEAHLSDGILELRFPIEAGRPVERRTVTVQ